jgi:threonine aldolase
VERLAEDHANARRLAFGLAEIDELGIEPSTVQTNMLFLHLGPERSAALAAYLRTLGILIAGRDAIRLVTHLDVTADDVETVIGACKNFFAARRQ